jgi:hypothetical protein
MVKKKSETSFIEVSDFFSPPSITQADLYFKAACRPEGHSAASMPGGFKGPPIGS